jgi:hypothetical protein
MQRSHIQIEQCIGIPLFGNRQADGGGQVFHTESLTDNARNG